MNNPLSVAGVAVGATLHANELTKEPITDKERIDKLAMQCSYLENRVEALEIYFQKGWHNYECLWAWIGHHISDLEKNGWKVVDNKKGQSDSSSILLDRKNKHGQSCPVYVWTDDRAFITKVQAMNQMG